MKQRHGELFRERLSFLSNMHPVSISLDGRTYQSVESAYQASKFPGHEEEFVLLNGYEAKKKSRTMHTASPSLEERVQLMSGLLWQKFERPDLRAKLLEMEGDIVEFNNWHDNTWGRCMCANCIGKPKTNLLGRLLMRVRETIQEDIS